MNKEKFIEEISKLGINYDDEKLAQLEKYYDLLINWNEKINLTAITVKEDVYLKHFYDSLTLVKAINLEKEETFCDLGTGAGFPGIVIKIFYPHLKMTLVDALNKRINFLSIVVKELDLKDVELIHARAEDFGKTNREIFDVVTARAVASLNILLEYSMPLLKINKHFIAMKGKETTEQSEKALETLGGKITGNIEFLLPIEKSARTLIRVKKIKATPLKFPRKYQEIKNKTL